MPAMPGPFHVGQLPAEPDSFVGRHEELRQVSALLTGSRLVTLTGAGGVGKTRLALRAARQARETFPDGACFVQLSAVRDPGLVPLTIAGCLGLAEQSAESQLEAVITYLSERELLLVLDTCEHLVESCAMLAERVIGGAPGVTLLATSREPLDVTGEQCFPVSPLPADSAGIELFAQRAVAAVPSFALTAANRADVISVCRRLEGIPLAIELAAVRLRALSLSEISRRLDHRLNLLEGGKRGVAGRHRGLRDAIGWSYDLCEPAEQELWSALSAFPGSFGIDAAEEVCAAGVVDALVRLVDKSVLIKDGTDGYRMLDTVREFGAEALAGSGREEAVKKRFIHRYLTLAQRFDAEPLHGQLDQYLALRGEHDSIRAALEYAFTAEGQRRSGVALVTSLYWYWQISGLLQEATHWLTRGLGLFPGPSPERARLLVTRGFVAAYAGDVATGLADTEAGLALAGELGEERTYARGQLFRVRALLSAGRLAEAEAIGARAEKLLPAAGDPGYVAVLDVMLAFTYWAVDDHDRCFERCGEALRRLPVDDGERWASSYLLGLTGLCLFVQGHHVRGSQAERQAMSMKAELGDLVGFAYGLGTLAIIAFGQERYRRVTWLLGAGDALWARYGAVFSGTPGMEERIAAMEDGARRQLGAAAYETLRRAASEHPLEEIVRLAIDDAEDLPLDSPGSKSPAAL